MDFLVTARRSPEAYEFEGKAWEFFESAYYLYRQNLEDLYELIFMPMEAWTDLFDELVEGYTENLNFYPHMYILNPTSLLSSRWISSKLYKEIERIAETSFSVYFANEWEQYAVDYAEIYCRKFSKYAISVMMHQVLYVYKRDKIVMMFVNEDDEKIELIGELKKEDLKNIHRIESLIRLTV